MSNVWQNSKPVELCATHRAGDRTQVSIKSGVSFNIDDFQADKDRPPSLDSIEQHNQ